VYDVQDEVRFQGMIFILLHQYILSHFMLFSIINITILLMGMYSTVTMQYVKNGVFWDVTPCGSCKNQSFGGT
jgi:hypothetical protein